MINHFNNIDGVKAAYTSGTAAIAGELSMIVNNFIGMSSLELVNTAFQHAAWAVAIFAGIVSIVNGTRKWFKDDNEKSS